MVEGGLKAVLCHEIMISAVEKKGIGYISIHAKVNKGHFPGWQS
jgi:hypothetical protein